MKRPEEIQILNIEMRRGTLKDLIGQRAWENKYHGRWVGQILTVEVKEDEDAYAITRHEKKGLQ